MNEREWMRIAGEALQSLKRIEKTVSEPQTLSAHRIAANAKIDRALEYIAEVEEELENDPLAPVAYGENPELILKSIRKLLTDG